MARKNRPPSRRPGHRADVRAIYGVGMRYDPRPAPGVEMNHFRVRWGVAELIVPRRRPGREMLRAFGRGGAEFALTVEPPAILLSFRFGGEGNAWEEAFFPDGGLPDGERARPRPAWAGDPDEWAILVALLVDADTGVVTAMRPFSLPPDLSGPMERAVAEQARGPRDDGDLDRALLDLYLRHGSPDALARAALWKGRGADELAIWLAGGDVGRLEFRNEPFRQR